jgi:glycogen debranching enzyme
MKEKVARTRQPEEEPPEFYIPATRNLHDGRIRTLKSGDGFALLDRHGDASVSSDGVLGLYWRDTRHLSRFELEIDGWRPLLLSSNVQAPQAILAVDLTNPDILFSGQLELQRDTLHISRSLFLDNGACHQRLLIRSFSDRRRQLTVRFRFDADFADLFEIRGTPRARRGHLSKSLKSEAEVQFSYLGLDGVQRQTSIAFEPTPHHLDCGEARIKLELAPGASNALFAEVSCVHPTESAPRRRFLVSLRRRRGEEASSAAGHTRLETDNAVFNEVLERAVADLAMLTTETASGPYPYAGVPWFSTPFGRDGAITALFTLWTDPALARGVLQFLASTQARAEKRDADAEPGKILHEMRSGEMAQTGEVPFGLYYGSVDSTPLFVLLAGHYWRRTGDLDTVAALWPQIAAALDWVDRYGDLDGDGLIEYAAKADSGLLNQGWKDSNDSIFHADGALAQGPIALIEVQAYVHEARWLGAVLARKLGHSDLARDLERKAEELRMLIEERFWLAELDTYALALDGGKRPCRVRSSNAGHVLFGNVASGPRAAAMARTLLARESFSGWGIRTIAEGEPRYNPMSYHNGSVWPHDNAMIALGLAEYGLTAEAARLLSGLFEAARRFELRRLPELFCGFARRRHAGPTAYPVACAPQAWSSAAVFALLQACLGLSFAPDQRQVRFRRPRLPEFLDRLAIRGLTLGENEIDVVIHRAGGSVSVHAYPRRGDLPVVVTL